MATKTVLAYSLATAFVIGFVYMIVLRLFGGPIIYLSIVGLIASTGSGGWMLYQTSLGMPETNEQKLYYLYGSYTIWGFTSVILCCAICNMKNIRIGVAVMQCTAKFIGCTPQIFLVPPISLVLLISWLVVWMVMSLFIMSVGEVKPND